jgi:hypothetical protein
MERRSFKWLRRIGIGLGVLVCGALIVYFVFNERMPKGKVGAEAEALATKIQAAINIEAWDTTEAVQWTFKETHTFLWDKKRHWVKVNWGENEALIRIDSVDGRVWKNGEEVTSAKKRDKLLNRGLYFWMNDSFWLNAPAKLFDKGTERRLVNYEGEDALLITYSSGGVTPGDSYLWRVDENGLPKSWKLWVKIIPIGGVEFTWDKWTTTKTGAKIATLHEGLLELPITNVKTGALLDFGEKDPFEPLANL